MRVIASWCAHSRRWQARLDGISTGASPGAQAERLRGGRLPTLKQPDLAQLLPHHWRPVTDVRVTSPIAAPTTAPELVAA